MEQARYADIVGPLAMDAMQGVNPADELVGSCLRAHLGEGSQARAKQLGVVTLVAAIDQLADLARIHLTSFEVKFGVAQEVAAEFTTYSCDGDVSPGDCQFLLGAVPSESIQRPLGAEISNKWQ